MSIMLKKLKNKSRNKKKKTKRIPNKETLEVQEERILLKDEIRIPETEVELLLKKEDQILKRKLYEEASCLVLLILKATL